MSVDCTATIEDHAGDPDQGESQGDYNAGVTITIDVPATTSGLPVPANIRVPVTMNSRLGRVDIVFDVALADVHGNGILPLPISVARPPFNWTTPNGTLTVRANIVLRTATATK